MKSFEQELQRIESDPKLRFARARAKAARRISGLLVAMRKSAKLTQSELAARIGVSQARISQVESGLIDHTPSVDFAFVFAAGCGRSLVMASAPLEELAAPGGDAELFGEVVAAAAPELTPVEAAHVGKDISRLLEEARKAHATEEPPLPDESMI